MTANQIAYGVDMSGARLVPCRYEPHQHMEGVAGDRIASEQEGAICQRQRQQRQRRRRVRHLRFEETCRWHSNDFNDFLMFLTAFSKIQNKPTPPYLRAR